MCDKHIIHPNNNKWGRGEVEQESGRIGAGLGEGCRREKG